MKEPAEDLVEGGGIRGNKESLMAPRFLALKINGGDSDAV